MATGGLYGQSSAGIVSPQSGSESVGLYGNNTVFGGSYFEWFIFQVADVQPATPTGGSWDFTTNTGTPPSGWLASPPANPTNTVWVSVGVVSSKNNTAIVWSEPGKFSFASGLPILSGASAPVSGDGQSDQLYIETGTTPETIWFKQAGTWTRLTGSSLYMDLTSNQTIAGTKTFSSEIQGSVSGTSSNVSGIVDITHGGTGSTTASAARTALGAAASGANSDITSLSGITGGISTADYLQLDTTITPSVGVAKLQWDTTWGGPQIGMEGGNVNLQIGQETLIRVYNNTGSSLTDGQVVYVTGSQGQRLTVALAQANADSTSATIIGMVTETIANNSSGFVTTQGMVNNINTNGSSDGAVVYLSPTTPGGWTTTKPVAPQHMVMVGYIVKGGSAGAGSIYINTQNGYELEELHNVLITSPTTGQTLVYNASTSVWENSNAVVVNGGTINNTVIGNTTPAAGTFETLSSTGNTTLGDASTDTVTVNGYMGVGGVGSAAIGLRVNHTALTGASQDGIQSAPVGTSSATTQVRAFAAQPSTADAAFTCGATYGFRALNTVKGTGSTINNQYGFYADDQTNGTNNYGAVLNVSSGTNKWNIYASGTAQNYFAGNVGVGTSSPSYKLDVFSGTNNSTIAKFTGGQSAKGLIVSTYASNGNDGGANLASTDSLSFSTASSERMRIDSSGNLGLGVTPNAWSSEFRTMQIGLGGAVYGRTVVGDGDKVGMSANVYKNTSFVDTYITTDSASKYDQAGGAHIFYTAPSGTAGTAITFTQAMTLNASGNLGIGTSSPLATIDIVGAANTGDPALPFQIRVASTAAYNTTPTSGIMFLNKYNTGGSYAGMGGISVYKENTTDGNYASALALFTRPNAGSVTKVATIDSSGNLGLGVTPSAWGSGNRGSLELGPSYKSLALTGDSPAEGRVMQNAYYNGTNWIYSASYGASGYRQTQGSHQWYSAASGTAGNAITFTQAMTLDASGRLGIGVTGPTQKLQISDGTYSNFYVAPGYASGTGTLLGVGGGEYLAFATNGLATERARIDSSGNVGIGTTSPNAKLAVNGSATLANGGYLGWGNADTLIYGDSSSNYMYFRTNGAEKARIDSSGNLLVGTTVAYNYPTTAGIYLYSQSPGYLLNNGTSTGGISLALFYSSYSVANQSKFEVTSEGNVKSRTNSYAGFSDERLKQNITPASSQWNDIKAYDVVKFQMKSEQFSDEENPWMLGVVAQQVEQISPGLVDEDAKDGMKTVKYSILYMKAVKALQENMIRTEALESAIQEQQAIITQLQADVAALKGN